MQPPPKKKRKPQQPSIEAFLVAGTKQQQLPPPPVRQRQRQARIGDLKKVVQLKSLSASPSELRRLCDVLARGLRSSGTGGTGGGAEAGTSSAADAAADVTEQLVEALRALASYVLSAAMLQQVPALGKRVRLLRQHPDARVAQLAARLVDKLRADVRGKALRAGGSSGGGGGGGGSEKGRG